MKPLIAKEFRLVVHPATYVLVVLGVLVLIPSWMYGVIFIYGILIAFFNGLNAREMHDLSYSFALPVSRRAMVQARMQVMVVIEAVMLLIMTAFVLLREPLGINGFALTQAPVGCGANLYLIGFGFVTFGLFNAVFYPRYFRNPLKVGVPFMIACIPAAIIIAALEVLPYLPWNLGTMLSLPGFHDVGWQLVLLSVSVVLFVLTTICAYRAAVRAFSTFDL